MLKIDWTKVPHKHGIYLWKNKYNEIIYVGKANNLNNRMKQYFKGMENSFKTKHLVKNIYEYDFVITNNEKEALILEKNYIDKFMPKYNILLRDDKRYPYIAISLKEILSIKIIYNIKNKNINNSVIFGPYPNGYHVKKIINLISKLTLFENGLLIKNKPKKFWEDKFKLAKNILTNNSSHVLKELKIKMIQASNNLQFELAQEIKLLISALVENKKEQNIELIDDNEIDVIAFTRVDDLMLVSILFYRYGSLLSNKHYVIDILENEEYSINEFFIRFYQLNKKPNLIISNKKSNISTVPLRGKYKKILNIAIINNEENMKLKVLRYNKNNEVISKSLKFLAKISNLSHVNHIMMIDNSHTINLEPVSAFVSYRNGLKQPKEYRKYFLVKKTRKADVEYMKQGLKKYFSKPENKIPDLLILDGSIAQVNEALKLNLKLNIIGLAKDSNHKTSHIILPNHKIIEINDIDILNYLSSIQIEVDRYAKVSHRKKIIVKTLEGKLISIKGVGIQSEKRLLTHFGNYSSIYNASISELEKVVSKNIAKIIFQNFKK